MPNTKNEDIFHLVKSMEKSEKRNFKLYMKRVSGSNQLIIMQLFDAIDKADIYNEERILKKNKEIKKQQLSNLKAHLTKQILASLRILNEENNISIWVTEQIHNAHIYYNKGLYHQSLKVLNKAKTVAQNYNLTFSVIQILNMEKKIESLHITRSMDNRAETMAHEVNEANEHITLQGELSNLSLNMYGLYIKNGHARNKDDVQSLKEYFKKHLPANSDKGMNFYEKLHYYQAHSWYYFILQNLGMFYRYTQKWYNIFQLEPQMQIAEPDHYLKAFHNLLNAHFATNNYEKYETVLQNFEDYAATSIAQSTINLRVKTFVYLYTEKLNVHFLKGTFSKGLSLIPEIIKGINKYKLHIDNHRILLFYYKIACLYFGSGDKENTIIYLTKIINGPTDLRTDIQCYARLLHLIAHYELNNTDLMQYLLKSVYRFMANMQNLSVVEMHIFEFLKRSFSLSEKNITREFKILKDKLSALERNSVDTRSFMYLDVISWLESRIKKVPVENIIREKYLLNTAQ